MNELRQDVLKYAQEYHQLISRPSIEAKEIAEKKLDELMEKIEAHTGKTKPSANKELFYELCEILMQGRQVKFTPARANKLRLRLKTFSVDEMKRVARTIASDEFMMGDNPGNRKYGNIDYLLRSDEKMDEWLNNANEQTQVDLTKVKF